MKQKISLLSVFSLTLLLSSPSLALDNPYASGGSEYGEEATNVTNPSSYSSLGSSSSNTTPSPSITAESTVSSSPYNNANSAPLEPSQSSPPNPDKPWTKVGTWFQKKTAPKPSGQADYDLANQRIQAGKARIRAIKAKERLDRHISDCNERTNELTRELEKSEEQAALMENQVKFQENNLNSASTGTGSN